MARIITNHVEKEKAFRMIVIAKVPNSLIVIFNLTNSIQIAAIREKMIARISPLLIAITSKRFDAKIEMNLLVSRGEKYFLS